jgi:hypothetical protein
MSLFREIYGYEDQKPEPVRKAAALPMDSPLFEYSPTTGAGDALCAKLENDTLANEILGPRERPATPATAPTAFELNFERIWHSASDRVAALAKHAPVRRRAIAAIVEKARRAAPACIRDSDGWISLQESCERFVSQAILGV